MSAKPRVEAYARTLSESTVNSVRSASAQKTRSRVSMLHQVFADPDAARTRAAEIKGYVLDNLGTLLESFEREATKNGVQFHWATDAAEARSIIAEIVQKAAKPGATIVKAKSMATEEIHLNDALIRLGYDVVETDLGEYVVQIDHDTPSHIVTPIIHKNRKQIAQSFEREGLGPYTEVPEELAMQARVRLRNAFRSASIGISGVNYAIADTGRIVLVENEGNNRLSTTAPRVHIALMGIEKVLPSESDLPLFLRLLAGSATGQHVTTYSHFIAGPRLPDQLDGPEEVHVVMLDNGRSKAVNGPYRDILKCIRCGACLNVCPVYRQASGHAYDHVYSGPLGAVLAPVLEGVDKLGDLAKASTLCGACEEVCPVQIPIPHMLLMLRDEAFRAGVIKEPIPWSAYAFAGTNPTVWKAGLTVLPMASVAPHPMKWGWSEFRENPTRIGRNFRKWWGSREK